MSEGSRGRTGIDLAQFDSWDLGQQRAGLDAHVSHRESVLSEYRCLVEHLRLRSEASEHDRELYELYELAVSHLSIDELTHFDLVTIARIHREPISHADSFFRSIAMRRRKKQLGPVPEKHLGIDKVKDQLFAEVLGVRTPETFYAGTFGAIPRALRTGVMLKPMVSSDSRGAFYVFSETNIFSIEHSKTLTSWDELSDALITQFGAEWVEHSDWEIQELIYEGDDQPARDLKFHTFYGKIGLILEAVRYPSWQYAYFNGDLTPADCGREHYPRFGDQSETLIAQGRLSREKIEMAEWISAQTPTPYMRIDFVNTETEMVFLEFSSAPGMSHTWNDDYDRLMGQYYNEAEIRLVNDLLEGKQFGRFREFSQRLEMLRAR